MKLVWDYAQPQGFREGGPILKLGKYTLAKIWWKGSTAHDPKKYQATSYMTGIVPDLKMFASQKEAADKIEAVVVHWLKGLGLIQSTEEVEFDRTGVKHVQG